jgi:hypothetical protein
MMSFSGGQQSKGAFCQFMQLLSRSQARSPSSCLQFKTFT